MIVDIMFGALGLICVTVPVIRVFCSTELPNSAKKALEKDSYLRNGK